MEFSGFIGLLVWKKISAAVNGRNHIQVGGRKGSDVRRTGRVVRIDGNRVPKRSCEIGAVPKAIVDTGD
jgi:hypothetical protein